MLFWCPVFGRNLPGTTWSVVVSHVVRLVRYAALPSSDLYDLMQPVTSSFSHVGRLMTPMAIDLCSGSF